MFLFCDYLFLWLFLRESQEHEVYLGQEDCLDKRWVSSAQKRFDLKKNAEFCKLMHGEMVSVV